MLLILLASLMLLWTALANGRPAVFTDTALYYSDGEYLFEALGWLKPGQAATPPGDPTDLPAIPGAPDISAAIDGARSPLYGAPLYALQRLGGLWLVAWAQALAVAGMLYVLFRAAAPEAPRWGYLALSAGLAALSPLPFFVGFMMPDVFAGVAACGLLTLLVYPDRLSARGRIGVAALCAYGLAVHRSNLLDAAALTGVGAGVLALCGVAWREIAIRAAWIAGAGAVAVLAGALVYLPIRARAGEPIGTPPFLSARVLADGPGRRFLRRACALDPDAFALCPFRDRPLASSDQILWSNRRKTAVFVAAAPVQREAMERQDSRFALDAVLSDSIGEMGAAALNSVRQFGEAWVDDPLKRQDYYVHDGYWRHTALPRILPDAAACAGRGGCPPRVTALESGWLEGIGLAAAVLLLGWRLSAADFRAAPARRAGPLGTDDDRARLLTLVGLVLALLIANAVACGALSGPFPRYQARLVWLLPMAAGLVAARAGVRRRGTGA